MSDGFRYIPWLRSALFLVLSVLSLAGFPRRTASAPIPTTSLEDRLHVPRAEFAQQLGRVRPGMHRSEVLTLLGEPGDIRTQRDPGAIRAARTVEVWSYGSHGHLSLGTLGTVHIQEDGTVQYVFGRTETPPPPGLFQEAQLRRLLRLLDAVPSYNSPAPDPLPLIQAVNALQRMGKMRAIAALLEYLRVSSWLDSEGPEGTFLVVRALFDVPLPPGYQPTMQCGAAAPPPPADLSKIPRFPLLLLEDLPLRVVGGYVLGGAAQTPLSHLGWFRDHGVLRAQPLKPTADPLQLVERLVALDNAGLRALTGLQGEEGRKFLAWQIFRMLRTLIPLPPETGATARELLHQAKARSGSQSLHWDAVSDRYVR